MTDSINLQYLFRMTDDTGIFQHSVFGIPDPSEGYTTDDNARALILAIMLQERYHEQRYEKMAAHYLSFLLYAEKGRWFRNFMDYSRTFTEKRGSEDCFGRCLLALGFVASRQDIQVSIKGCAEHLLNRVVSSCSSLSYIKGKAYALTGLTLWNNPCAQPYVKMLRDSIADTYVQCRREDWRWFEGKMTYCSAILPLAVLNAYKTEEPQIKIGLESLDFLAETAFHNGMFIPIGCKGWFSLGKKMALYDEQPVEACSMMLTCFKAYQITKNSKYLDEAKNCFLWYLGKNITKTPMIDSQTGGCYDGLKPNGLNPNEGAESLVCWLIAALIAEKNGWFPESKK
ncbi:MAG TPA: glycosyltransferase [Ruminococcaceae bacterium]|nr:glycosyltransferase [Oscillospiraceae bacterium]